MLVRIAEIIQVSPEKLKTEDPERKTGFSKNRDIMTTIAHDINSLSDNMAEMNIDLSEAQKSRMDKIEQIRLAKKINKRILVLGIVFLILLFAGLSIRRNLIGPGGGAEGSAHLVAKNGEPIVNGTGAAHFVTPDS